MAEDSKDDSNNIERLPTLDASEFRVSASDALGHSRKKTVPMPPMMANMISVLLAGKRFPYRTEGELMRHAMMRHIKYLERISDIPSVSAQLEAMNAILYQEQLNEEWLETYNRMGTRMASFVSNNAYGEARRLFKEQEKLIGRMPEGYWKERSRKKLYEQHGWIMGKEYDEKCDEKATSMLLSNR